MLNIPAIRNASAFCAAAAIVSSYRSLVQARPALAFQVYRPAVNLYRPTFNPTVTTRLWQPSCSTIISSMPAEFGIANITIYDPVSHPGGLFVIFAARHRQLSIRWRRGRLRQSDVAHGYYQ